MTTHARHDPPKKKNNGLLFLALFVCVAGCNSQRSAVAVEAHGGNGRGIFGVLLEAFLVDAVPHIDHAVSAARHKRAVSTLFVWRDIK